MDKQWGENVVLSSNKVIMSRLTFWKKVTA